MMNTEVHSFVKLIEDNKSINTKEEMIDVVCANFDMQKDGKALYHTPSFAVVFCYSKNDTFSNVVLALSKLKKYDDKPCFVVLVKKDLDNVIHLMNSTFLDKISHSSQKLTIDKIRGSFLGSNILKSICIGEENKSNSHKHFDALFSHHKCFKWEDNLERLVERTNDIKPTKDKEVLSEEELDNLFKAPRRAIDFIKSNGYNLLLQDFRKRCDDLKNAISVASKINNVNIRGRLLEALITANEEERCRLLNNLDNVEHLLPTYDTKNDLGDDIRSLNGSHIYTDIKTKILSLDSNPKAYNIDKFLKCMGKDNTVFLFFFVGIDDTGAVTTILTSVFHDKLQETTLLQHHWAGRGTRGGAQFSGRTINELLQEKDFVNNIDEEKSKQFLKKLLAL